MSITRHLLAASIAALVAVPAFAAAPAAPEGCGCKPRPSHAVDAMSRSRAVFAGRVQSVAEQPDALFVTFSVARAWKGSRAESITVATPKDACGVGFEVGGDYLVFASGAKTALVTDACSTTTLAASGSEVHQLDMNGGYSGKPLRMP